MTVLMVMAKAPVPGRVKTRLCPPASLAQAAEVAAAALLDTLDAVRAVPDATPVLALAGRLRDAARGAEIRTALAGWHLLPQRGHGLAQRLAAAHADAAAAFPGRPVLQIGMDTPQVRPDLLAAAVARLVDARPGTAVDAVLGPAVDGGWWALGLRDPRAATALRDVPMSTPSTGRLTRAALLDRGLRIAPLPTLPDVDDWSTALQVAARTPGGRFARTVRRVAATPDHEQPPTGGAAPHAGRAGAGRAASPALSASAIVPSHAGADVPAGSRSGTHDAARSVAGGVRAGAGGAR